MIRVESLTKRFPGVTAVRDLSFEVPAGQVTGLIGPNGAGKSTTLRAILGLERPSEGRALIDELPYAELPAPAQVVGAVLDPQAVQPGRTARDHLGWAAAAIGAPRERVDDVLEEVGLTDAARRRAGALSLGMRQRLALAVALLGRPAVLVLDEPLNGLDPEGIVWLRGLVRRHAANGGTVLVSSHLLRELQETADRVVLIAQGRLVAERAMAEFTGSATRVVADASLSEALTRAGARVARDGAALIVRGLSSREIGRIACDKRLPLTELTPQRDGLEAAFLRLVEEKQP